MSVARKFIRQIFAPAAAAALSLATGGIAFAFGNGPPPGFTSGFDDPDCTTCHFDNEVNAPGGAVSLEGVTTSFVAGRRYQLRVAVEHPDLENGGFQLVVRNTDGESAGELHTDGAGVGTIHEATSGQTYAQHSGAGVKAASSDAVEWVINWDAPTDSDEVIINVAAMASNDDGSPLGDHTYTLVRQLTVNATGSVADNTLTNEQDRQAPGFWRQTRYNLRWAGAASNLSYITRFIAEGMLERLGRDTGYIAYGTRGNSTSENIYALGEHEVDFAITTPPVMAALAYAGKAYFKKPYTDLRAIAVFPQNDWVTCVADASLGISSYGELRERKLAVKIATNRIGRENGISFLVEQMFRAHGITPDDIESWGGSFIEVLGAGGAAVKVRDGEADIACHEYWKAFYRLTDTRPVTFLPVTEGALDELSRQFGYQRNIVPKDIYGPGIPAEEVLAVDYSDWLVLVNANVPDDIAYMAAKVAVEDRERGYETIYWGLSDRQRSADIPVDPKLMWKNVGVALHPGAERYYREAGLMP